MTKPDVVSLSPASIKALASAIEKVLERQNKKVNRKARLTEPASSEPDEERGV